MSSRPSRNQYSRVDGGNESATRHTSREEKRRLRSAKAEEYSVKLHAALWVAAAVAATYYSDIIAVCRKSELVNRFWLDLGALLFALASVLVLYMAIWVPRVQKCNLDPMVYSPRMIPCTAVTSIFSVIFLIAGLWPVYGLFTPGLLALLWIGGLMSAHFLPAM